jgi:hypothetical protein
MNERGMGGPEGLRVRTPALHGGGGHQVQKRPSCTSLFVRFALQEDGGVFEDEGDGAFHAGVGIAEGVGF